MKYLSTTTVSLLLVLASPLALAGKPDCPGGPPCKDDDGGAAKDVPANATFLEYQGDIVLSDGLVPNDTYFDGQDRVNCKIGRGGLFGLTTSNRISGPRKVCLSDDEYLGDYCESFLPPDRCLVANMRTDPSPERGGVDLRSLVEGQVEPTGFWMQLYNNKQNFFAIHYDAVEVEAIGFDGNGPNRWRITDADGSADVYRIENNQYVDRIQCGADDAVRFLLPFHLEVELQ